MIAVTGASGHLGRLVTDSLLKKAPPSEVVAASRNPEKVAIGHRYRRRSK
jgi:NAD(P)H dehydrogenase (quinone)